MRTKLAVLAVLLVVFALSVSAVSATDLLGAVSFPIWSERTTEAHAGVTQTVTFSDMSDGAVKAFYKNGFLVVPKDKYGVFAEMSYLRMDPMVLGIKPEFVRNISSGVNASKGVTVNGDGSIVVCIEALTPDLYDIVTSVTNNQGRRDERGIVPVVLQVIGRKTHHQISVTDTAAGAFGVIDASRYVEMFCHYQLGIDDPAMMTPEQKYICKSVYFDSRLKGVLEFSEAVADYSWLSQGLALRLQGMNPPMSPAPAGPDSAMAEYQRQIETMQGQIQQLTERLSAQQTSVVPVVQMPPPLPATEPIGVSVEPIRFSWNLSGLPAAICQIEIVGGPAPRQWSCQGPTVKFNGALPGKYFIRVDDSAWRALELDGPATIDWNNLEVK